MWLIHYVNDGMPTYIGINWNRNYMSRIRIILRTRHTSYYFRWRSKHAGGKRFIFEVHHAS